MKDRLKKQQRKTRRNNIIAGLIMVFLMTFSILAYSFGADEASVLEYNGHNFKQETKDGQTYFVTKINDIKVNFYAWPLDIKSNIVVPEGFDSELKSAKSFSFSKEPIPLNTQTILNNIYHELLIKDMSKYSGKSILVGNSKEDLISDLPVVTCEDASSNNVVFVMKKDYYDNLTNIEFSKVSEHCYELKSNDFNIMFLRDYMLYSTLGVFDENVTN